MRKFALIAGLTAFAMAGAAHAQYHSPYGQAPTTNCERVKNDQRLAGALVGGVIGGVAGGAIGNNIDNDGHYYGHGYRGYRGHRGYRHRGYGRHRGYHHGGDNDGEVIAGALIGALIGGVAGAELATSDTDCRPQIYQGVPAPTRDPYGPGWNEPQSVSADPFGRDLYGGQNDRRYERPQEEPRYSPPPREYGRECRVVTRETTLPDGQRIREETQACRESPNDDWALQ